MTLFEAVTAFQPEMPPQKSDAIIGYENIVRSDEFQKKDFETQERFKRMFYKKNEKYYEERWSAAIHNWKAVTWLCEYRDQLSPTNLGELKAIENKLKQFMRVILKQSDWPPALALNISKMRLIDIQNRPVEVSWHD